VSRLSRQCALLNISQPYRPTRPFTGIALLLLFTLGSLSDKLKAYTQMWIFCQVGRGQNDEESAALNPTGRPTRMLDTVDSYSVLLQRYPATATSLRLLAKLPYRKMCPVERTERKTNVMLRLMNGEHVARKLTPENSKFPSILFNFWSQDTVPLTVSEKEYSCHL
jgi:hypothetical protein